MSATIAIRASGTGTFNPASVPGSFFELQIDITGDSSYPATATNGYPFGVAQLQAVTGGAYSAIDSIDVVNPWTDNATAPAHAFTASYDKTHGTIRAFGMAAAAGQSTPLLEVANAANLSTYTCTVRVRFY